MQNIVVKVLVGAIIAVIALAVLIRIAWISILLLPLFIIAGIVLAFVIVFAKLGERSDTKQS